MAANSILTPTAVTREILRVLHEKLSFISTVIRSYDDSFAKTGAKIGDSLRIRLPNKYTVRTGKTLAPQDTHETSVTLTVADQKGVDMNFSSAELTMDLDDYSDRIIKPAMNVLASDIEGTMLSTVTPELYNTVGTAGTPPADLLTALQARVKLNQYLAPKDDNRCIQYESGSMAATVDGLKGLFQDSKEISKQYTEGMMGRTAGFKWFENERAYVHQNGADVTGLTINDGSIVDGDNTITTAGGTVSVGSTFTFDAVFAVHGETKQPYSHLQQFTLTDVAGNNWTFEPALNLTGANQNIDALPVNLSAIVMDGGDGDSIINNIAYHKEAFAFASADLEMPQGIHFAAREVLDGLSIRIVRQYDINNDNLPCRLDILHGFKTLRPELGVRVLG